MTRPYVLEGNGRPRGDLSKSKAERFLLCPEAYRRAFREGDQGPRAEILDVGTLSHKVIEIEALTRFKEIESGLRSSLAEPVEPEELIETLRYAVPLLDDPVTPGVILQVEAFLEKAAKRISFADAVAVEEPFSVDFGGGRTFVGIRDIRKQEGDTVHIVDWKTGWITQSDDELLDDLQAIGYLYAARRQFPAANKIKVTFEYLARSTRSSLWWTPAIDRAAELHMRDVMARIEREREKERAFLKEAAEVGVSTRADNIWPAKTGTHCTDCQFRSSCEAYATWVNSHGREPTRPLDGLTLEQVAAEAIKSRTLSEVHDARRKDAYARIQREMGNADKVKLAGHYFISRKKEQSRDPTPSEHIQVLTQAGIPEDEARTIMVPEVKIDGDRLKELVAKLPKDVRKWVWKELNDRTEVYSGKSYLEAREAPDTNPFG